MTFVLVDYKGGSGVQGLRPAAAHRRHGHRPRRPPGRAGADSLGAELRRREHMLADAGAKDIEDYLDLRARRARAAAAAAAAHRHRRVRLDGRASCPTSSPAWSTSPSAGRSLGIHLLLATQRPAGVVSPGDPRQHQPADRAAGHRRAPRATDVIDAPDAARSPSATPGPRLRPARPRLAGPVPGRPGRRPAAGRGGAGRRPTRGRPAGLAPSSAGRAAAAEPAATPERRGDHRPVACSSTPSAQATRARGHPAAAQPLAARAAGAAVLAGSAGAVGIGRRLRRGPVRRSTDLPGAPGPADGGRSTSPRRPPAGRSAPPRTGRSAAAAHVRRRRWPAHCSRATCTCTGSTAATARCCRWHALPHCGAVVTRTQPERAVRLLGRLARGGRRRQQAARATAASPTSPSSGRRSRAGPSGCRTSCCCSTAGRASCPPSGRSTAAGSTDVLCHAAARRRVASASPAVITGDRSLRTGRISHR